MYIVPFSNLISKVSQRVFCLSLDISEINLHGNYWSSDSQTDIVFQATLVPTENGAHSSERA